MSKKLLTKVKSVITKQAFDPIPFTEEAFADLKKDYQVLLKKRAEVMIRLQTAREMGDLSENGAYTYAKFELGSISRQLRKLKHLLTNGVVTKHTQSHTVAFGSTVRVSTDNKEYVYTLVSVHESNPQKGKLSIESPIGAALLQQAKGDVVSINTPTGIKTFTIISINDN